MQVKRKGKKGGAKALKLPVLRKKGKFAALNSSRSLAKAEAAAQQPHRVGPKYAPGNKAKNKKVKEKKAKDKMGKDRRHTHQKVRSCRWMLEQPHQT